MASPQGRTRIPDVHPDDGAARLRIRGELRAAREEAGLSRAAFGELVGRSKGSIQKLEERDYWTVRMVQWWARGLGRRFGWQLCGIPPLLPDAVAAMYAGMRPSTPDAVDELAVAVLITDMARARVACRVTQARLAARLGITAGSVTCAERVKDNLDVAAGQRHLRGLGGWLELRVDPAGGLPATERSRS